MRSGINSYKLSFFVLAIFVSQSTFANKNIEIINTNIKVDFRSMHIWRGIAASYVPTIEPTFEVSKNNSKTGIWMAQSIDGNYTELDLYFTYNYSDFSFTLYDYYCPPSIQASNEIANYNQNNTNHTIELNLAFSGNEKIPFNVLIATMIYGDDLNSETNKNNYSTYIQVGYSAKIENSSVDLFVGISPFKSYYGETAGVVNAGLTTTKNLSLSKTKAIPVQASLITNPMKRSLFLNFGFTL
ncbi:MAG: hypothetical protein KAR57_05795 [Bacteroidales bacterium]|nr:hypothetical protein [Bacteroidales bacterium]